MRIFRDETDLSATPGGWENIESALAVTGHFILLASVKGAESKWVIKELNYWLDHKPSAGILIVLTDGEIVWDDTTGDFDWEITTALPKAIAGRIPSEPIWVDLRWAKKDFELSLRNPEFQTATARIAAPVRGVDLETLISEEHRQHKLTMRWAYGAVITLILLLIAVGITARVASQQRQTAVKQRDIALARQLAAQADALRGTSGDSLRLSTLVAIQSVAERQTWAGVQALNRNLALMPRVTAVPCDRDYTDCVFSRNGRYLMLSGKGGKSIIELDTQGQPLVDRDEQVIDSSMEESEFAIASKEPVALTFRETALRARIWPGKLDPYTVTLKAPPARPNTGLMY